ncbi:uncharacterized protein LOC122404101 [Colletes gigas]|uniref:uncharacterized protein LOC122404101 n=1 Tax=Colletes gigas TaxID=935657 RepID=UPI001C9AD007|nr:uncharacterized protein LOC122404101 [Colletes gigas]
MAVNNATSDGHLGSVDSYRVPKIPKFFRDDPMLWFLQVEATFNTARITDARTRVDYLVAALDPEVVSSIRDLLTGPRSDDIYDLVKTRIMSAYAASAESRLRQLLKGQVTTEGKPSQILYRLRALDDGRCDDEVMRSIFLEQMPEMVKTILVAAKVPKLQDLAEMADRICESTSQSSHVAASVNVRDRSNRDPMEAKLDRLTDAQWGICPI